MREDRRATTAGAPAAIAAALLFAFAVPATAADFETCWGHFEAGNWSQAASCFEELVPEYEGWAWGHHYLGVSLQQAGRPDDALKQLQLAMDLMPEDEEPGAAPFLTAAEVLEQKGRQRDALDVLGRAEPFLQPEERPEVEYIKGRISFAAERWKEAIRHLDRANRRDFETYYMKGVANYQTGDLEDACDALEEALRKNPSHGGSADFLALAFVKRAEGMANEQTKRALWERASKVARSMVDRNPRNADAHNLLGRAYMGAKDYDGALRQFKKVLELKPNHCFARFNRAQLHLAKEQWSEAARWGEQAMSCLPDRERKRSAHLLLGDAKMGQAKGIADGLGESDVEGRRKAIRAYGDAKAQFDSACDIRPTAGCRDKAASAQAAIDGFREQLATIEGNQSIEEENRRIEAEAERQRKMREEINRRRGGS